MGDRMTSGNPEKVPESSEAFKIMELPAEIRSKIWAEVLGNRTIHIEYHPATMDTDYYLESDGVYVEEVTENPATWDHSVCVAGLSEKEIHRKFVDGSNHDWEDCAFYHDQCSYPMLGAGQRLRVQLFLLRVNKKIYAEADHVLLTTNTFSIEHEECYQAFFVDLIPARKALLGKLRLSLDWTYVLGTLKRGSRRAQHLNAWNRYMTPTLIPQLTGLHTLHICMAQGFYEQSYLKTMKQIGLDFVNGICDFQALGKELKTLTVVLTDVDWGWSLRDVSDRKKEKVEEKYRWTLKERQDYCEKVRTKILG